MLYQITSFLLEVATGFLGGACLLRLYMQYQRVPFGNPVGRFVFALTDWLVLPLRRVVPSLGRWDMASLVGAYLFKLAQFGLLWLLGGGSGSPVWLLPMALIGLAQLALSCASGLVIVFAVLSWVQQGHSPLAALVTRLVEPWLVPIRRVLPLLGGIDLSPLVLLVLLQILGIVLDHLPANLFG